MQTLYLIRGLPGSGKTGLAGELTLFVYSADDFFVVDGIYKYEPQFIPDAHELCRERASRTLRLGSSVSVANTFTQRWELEPYYAIPGDHRVVEVTVTARHRNGEPLSDENLAERNVHGVPVEKIRNMRSRWEL